MRWCPTAALILLAADLGAADRTLNMPIGDPARRHKEVRVVLDAVTDGATGEMLTPDDLIRRLGSSRLIFLGESHTGMDFHIVQRRVIEGLLAAGRKVILGLEMYPYTEQKHLDDWCRGLLTERGFVQISRWYRNWGYHWNYYSGIFLLARDRGVRMFAVNTPREVVSAVRKKGFTDLTPEESAHIPPRVDTSNKEHFELFQAFFEEAEGMHSGMNEAQWRSMFEAQCTWDATMAFNAIRALKEHGDDETVMVVLIGSGHVAYGLGIERQAAGWFDGSMTSIIPVRVVDDKDRSIGSVQASYADFVWGLPPEKNPLYPELGISTGDAPGESRRKVLSVSKESPAKVAGFETGDVLISMDGTPLHDREAFNRLIAEKEWGDAASFVVRRGESEVPLRVYFRRKKP